MTILLHIIVALTSVAYTTYVFVAPTKTRLHVSYVLVAATLASGFYLALTSPAHILETCMVGLLYVGAVSLGLVSARNKLAAAASPIKTNRK